MKLLFKGAPHLPAYHGNGIHAAAGDTVDVTPELGATLLADFPGLFVELLEAKPMAQDVKAPPVDKQIKEFHKRGRR